MEAWNRGAYGSAAGPSEPQPQPAHFNPGAMAHARGAPWEHASEPMQFQLPLDHGLRQPMLVHPHGTQTTQYTSAERFSSEPMPTKLDASADPAVCGFVHTQCDQALFNAEYLRSNKASGHKNLRCFPHCCGGHNPKSFCGSGLVVECALPRVQVVLGRFEEVQRPSSVLLGRGRAGVEHLLRTELGVDDNDTNANDTNANTNANKTDAKGLPEEGGGDDDAMAHGAADAIAVGAEYARRALFDELKSSDNPFGSWFKGASALGPSGLPRFHLNGNRQSWHYGWQSSRLNCKNAHVFKVYFFRQSERDAARLRCVAELASPPFRISSSRKARKTFRSPSQPMSLSLSSSSEDMLALARTAMPTPSSSCSPDRRSSSSLDDVAVAVASASAAAAGAVAPLHAHAHAPPPPLRSRSSFDMSPAAFGSERDVLPSLSSRIPSRDGYRGQPDRKRLTRSASLQTDYYSSSGPSSMAHAAAMLQPRAQTFLGDEYRPRMLSLTSLLHASPTSPAEVSDQRASLAALASPIALHATPSGGTLSTLHHPVATPVVDMMQLRLETPRDHQLPRASSSSSLSSVMSTESTLSSLSRHKAKRKRNRSGDSSKAAALGNQAEPAWFEGPLMEEIAPQGEWDPVARAHLLGLAVAIASRINRAEEARSHSDPTDVSPSTLQLRAIDLTFSTPAGASVVSTASTHPSLQRFYAILLQASAALLDSDVILDVRQRVQDLAVQNAALAQVYEAMLLQLEARVEAALAHLVTRQDATSPSLLVELFRSCERELMKESWFGGVDIYDTDEDEYPFIQFVSDYYAAICVSREYEALALPREPSTGLTGDWRLAGADNVVHGAGRLLPSCAPLAWLERQVHSYMSQVMRIVETDSQLIVTMGNSLVASAHPLSATLGEREPSVVVPGDHFPFAWTRQNLMIATRAWRVRSMDDRNGSAITLQGMKWPTLADFCGCVVKSGVDGREQPESEADPAASRQLVRTRWTTHYSMVSSTRLQVRLIVEVSETSNAQLCAMATSVPNTADMVEYFKTPASWEMLAQTTMQYERV